MTPARQLGATLLILAAGWSIGAVELVAAEPDPGQRLLDLSVAEAESAESGLVPQVEVSSVLARMAGSLLVVLGLIWVAALVLRKWHHGPTRAGDRGRLVEVAEVLPLGGKKFIYTLRAIDRLLVVGVTSEKMQLLCELEEPDPAGEPASLAIHQEMGSHETDSVVVPS